jgi:hypothetical protein
MKEIEIKGNYYQTGFLIGSCHKNILKKIEEKVLKDLKIEDEKIKSYEKKFKNFHFLIEEIEGYCKGAEIKFENLLKIKLGNFNVPKLNCSSLFLSSEFVEENVSCAMKIRDEKPLPQYICQKVNNNKIPYLFSGSISDTGYGFFIKENGFLGINNTGSFLKKDFINENGFDDCDIMRIVAELCNKPEETIEIIKKMQQDKIIGYTGNKRGMIFLFTDRENTFYIEINSFNLNYKKIHGKFCFTNDFLIDDSKKWVEETETEGTKSSKKRKERLEEILKKNEKFNVKKLIEISRDKKNYPYSICRDTSLMSVRTISSFIALIHNEPVLYICVGNPFVSPYFPFHLKGNKLIENFIRGEISVKLDRIFEEKKLSDEEYLNKIRKFEDEIFKRFNEIEDIEEKNLEVQKEVFNFIMSGGKNESLYNS